MFKSYIISITDDPNIVLKIIEGDKTAKLTVQNLNFDLELSNYDVKSKNTNNSTQKSTYTKILKVFIKKLELVIEATKFGNPFDRESRIKLWVNKDNKQENMLV